jgi:hypothetical protein
MAQSIAGFNSILKEFYLGPIQDQLNEETLVCELFEKASVDWNGRNVIIPVHTARNPATGFVAEGGALPNATTIPPLAGDPVAEQSYQNLTVTAQFLYGTFRITGPAMAAAGKGGANSFVGWMDSEMNRLVQDIKVACNRVATSGGVCIGFITYDQTNNAAARLPFDGDNVKLATVIAGGGANHVDLVPLGDDPATGAVAYNQFANGATLGPVGPLGTVAVGGLAVGAGFPTDAAGNAIPLAVVVNNVVPAVQNPLLNEPIGIYGNIGLSGGGNAALAGGAWFGLDRSSATATGVALQCSDAANAPAPFVAGAQVVVSNATSGITGTVGVGGVAARVQISIALLQNALDRQELASGTSPDVILCNPLQRTRLSAMLQGTMPLAGVAGASANVYDVKTKAMTGNAGFTGFNFGGIPVKTSRAVDNGLMLLLNTKTWKMCELESGKFADESGAVLTRVATADAWEGFYKWYYNTVCLRPNGNSLITGLTL